MLPQLHPDSLLHRLAANLWQSFRWGILISAVQYILFTVYCTDVWLLMCAGDDILFPQPKC